MKLDKSQLTNYVALIAFVLVGLLKVNIGSDEISQGLTAILVLTSLGNTLYQRHKDGKLMLGVFSEE